jgi:uncharacterized SAM-binding protein YcdF (DUF218 family)
MTVFLSKFLPLFLYPLGLSCVTLLIALSIRRESKGIKIFILISIALLWLSSNQWVSTSLRRSLEWQYIPPEILPSADVIVVLGGGSESAISPRQIVEINGAGDRMLYAAWLYHRGVASKLLLTGSYLPWDTQKTNSQAYEMGVVLQLLGVPEEDLWLETESLNTYENALKCADLLNREGIDRIVLVTSAVHMPRAVLSFEKQGLSVIPAPTDYTVAQDTWDRLWEPNLQVQLLNLLPNASDLSITTATLKEYLGILVYKLRGWA